MAGIVAALEAHDDVGLLRQPVNDLALPFVAPLGADDDNIGHFAAIPSATLIVQARSLRKTGADHVRGHAFRIRRPALITAGAARMRGTQSDKGSGLSTQARTASRQGSKRSSTY